MITIDTIKTSLETAHPRIMPGADAHRAAVAAILRERNGILELLFIERARVDGDPWSGHIAFPGGRTEAIDADARETAERETMEELGLDLNPALFIGRLNDIAAHIDPIKVSGFLYQLDQVGAFEYSEEVHKAFWFPLQSLADTVRHKPYRVPGEIPERIVPAIDVLGPDHTLLWGLTYRFVTQIMKHAGFKLPE